MILVDTSIWVAALRDATSPEALELRRLLDGDEVGIPGVVRLEILSGASRLDAPRLRRTLSALPVYRPGDDAWDRVEDWIERGREAGERFGVFDLVIGALAVERDAAIWSLDRDFERMSRLGFVRLHALGGLG